MDSQKSLEMGGSGSENVLLDDEVFHGLSPLEFRYPESNSINFDLDATYLLDNPSGTTFPSSTDVLPDQELTTLNSLPFPDQGVPEASFLNFPTQGVNSLPVPSQEMTGMSFTNLLTQGMNSRNVPSQEMTVMSFSDLLTHGTNPLTVPGREMYELGSSSFPTQNINSLNLHNQELSMMDTFGLSTQGGFVNTLEYPIPGLSMMDLLNLPTQVPYVNTLELPNQGLSTMDTFGLPTQESFTNTLDFLNHNLSMTNALSFPHQELSMLNALSLPAPQLTSIGFLNQGPSINTSGVPYQSQPVFTTMEENIGTTEIITISSSDDEQFQEEFDPNYGNDNGASGSNSNPPLRQTLSKEVISQYFYMPITDVAKVLNIGVTLLKLRCRELGFSHWPQRKLTSLQTLIAHLQEFGESSRIRVEGNVHEMIRRLEDERKRIEDTPDLPLEDDTIRLRQAYFKSSYRKRKRSDRDH